MPQLRVYGLVVRGFSVRIGFDEIRVKSRIQDNRRQTDAAKCDLCHSDVDKTSLSRFELVTL